MKNEKQYFIYKITNTANGKCYVGQTTNPKHRFFRCHQSNPKILADIDRYGVESFKVEILARTSDRKFAESMEEHFIDEFNTIENGYNRARSFHNNAGLKRTEAANGKRSKAIKRLVWVCNMFDLETRRVTPEEAARLEKEGWTLGRFTSKQGSANKRLFNVTVPEGTGDYFKTR